MSGFRPVETRINAGGYEEFWDEKLDRWVLTHRRAAENKFGTLRPGFHVHHLDVDKRNNRHENLVEVHDKVHRALHDDPGVCLRCGRSGHWSSRCRMRTFFDGTALVE